MDPKGKAKSVVLTPEGKARSKELFFKLFGKNGGDTRHTPLPHQSDG
jgi:Domain of unknown function (DUF6429)